MPTAQAGLASQCEAKTICPKQLPNLYPKTRIHDNILGIHMLGSYRNDWMKKIDGRVKKNAEKFTNYGSIL